MFPRCNNVVVTIGNCLTAGSCRPETSAHRCLTTHPRTPGTEQCRDGEYRSFNMTTVIMISSDNSIIINSGQDDAKLYRNRTQGYVNLNLTRPSPLVRVGLMENFSFLSFQELKQPSRSPIN